jgi:2-oxoisovalerate dehydrogenase E2 component (dihydrolipoyl transacylase)
MKIVPSPQSLRYLRQLIRPHALPLTATRPFLAAHNSHRHFHCSRVQRRIETHILSDIGEGVKEVQIIQWFVEEGAQIEEWGPLCEVQSDKAAVEITSKYTGVIKKLHFQRDAVVQVGDAMVDIEVEGRDGDAEQSSSTAEAEQQAQEREQAAEDTPAEQPRQESLPPNPEPESKPKGKHASLATPAVRGMLKEHNLAIEDIEGTGRDGRVLKEDVLNHVNKKPQPAESPSSASLTAGPQTETNKPLTAIQSAMFKSMTASLTIPHFLYTDTVNITTLAALRARLNANRDASTPKLTYMPFILKAVSLALQKYPLLNARLDTSASRPQLQLRSQHNIGVAMDTPAGLLVPVIPSAQSLSISSLATNLGALAEKARANKLSGTDLAGGTITVSNVGSIGGEVVAPVLVEGQLAICGVGKIKEVPVFDTEGKIQKALVVQMSWSADHRVVDGATMARAAECVKQYLEEPGRMVLDMV